MKRNYRLLFSLFLAFSFASIAYGQMLWPGDVNDNGVVNGIDVLYAGIAYGSVGPVRPGGNSTWQAQLLGGLWGQDFPDGTNYAYADCDGTGIVDEDDIKETIKDNFFLTHGALVPDSYSSGTPGVAPAIKIIPQNVNVGIGANVVFDLWLGDDEIAVNDFYGIAIRLNYNPDFTLGSEWEYEGIANPWIDPTDDDTEDIHQEIESQGIIELAITRTNQQSVSGAGKIGEFSVVIEDIIVGLQSDTLYLEIESIRMIDKDFNTLSVVADSTYVIISRPTSTSTPPFSSNLKVSPNPAKDFFTLTCDANIIGYELTDLSGRILQTQRRLQAGTKKMTIKVGDFKPEHQLYLLKVYTAQGIIVKKIILN